jgi:crossover junction endodeoxyribonuclease RuvC
VIIKKSLEKNILGIDPGFGRVGFGLISTGTGTTKHIRHGCITTKPNISFVQRLEIIYQELTKIIQESKPDLVAIEKIYFHKNVKTAVDVSQARGVIVLTVRLLKIPIVEFTPLQIKQAITGYGQADKKQIQKMVQLILKLKDMPKPDDAADALAAALCAEQTKIIN